MAQEGRDEKGLFIKGNQLWREAEQNGGRKPNVIDNMMLCVKCKECGEIKNWADFPKNNNSITGINRKCIKCTSNSYHPLSKSVKGRISQSLKLYKGIKKAKTIELLGLDIISYKEYLSSKFTSKMNWDNYGSYWEIDHIIPISKFNLDNEYEQKQAFHYTNTQPLTVKQNRSKNNRTIHDQFKLRI